MGEKKAIIGYSGFLGRNLCKQMKFDYQYNSQNIDLFDPDLPDKMPDDIGTIVFLAADPRLYYYRTRPAEAFRNNYELIRNILRCRYKKFIYVSTIGVYKDIGNFSKDPATGWNDETSFHGMAKLLAEKEVMEQAQDYCILRVSTLFSEEMSSGPLFDILNGNQSFVDLESRYSFIHVEDASRAIKHCMEKKLSGVYNVTADKSYSLRELFTGKEDIRFLSRRKFSYDSENSRFKATGWKQEHDIVDFVKRQISAKSSSVTARKRTAVKTACITGILGQDGSLLADFLLSKGYRVFGFVKEGTVLHSNFDPIRKKVLFQCDVVETDITDSDQMHTHIRHIRPDEFYHLAACHHAADRGIESNLELHKTMLDVNFGLTGIIAQALMELRKGCRFLFAGSSQMYSAVDVETTINETTPFSPSTFYGNTKVWSQQLISYYREQHGFWGCTAILFNHESPRRPNYFVTRKITEAVARIKFGLEEQIEILDINSKVDWSSAEDIIRGMHLMLSADFPKDYVLASGALHSVEEILETAFSHAGLDWRKHVRYPEGAASPKFSLVGDPSLIQKELGWQPQKDFKMWICEMVDYDCRFIEETTKTLAKGRPW